MGTSITYVTGIQKWDIYERSKKWGYGSESPSVDGMDPVIFENSPPYTSRYVL